MPQIDCGEADSELGWRRLFADMALTADDMQVGQSVSWRTEPGPCMVSITRLEPPRLRLEVTSNGHLLPSERIDGEGLDLLEELGWFPPTHFADDEAVAQPGCTNHFIDLVGAWSGEQVASVLVRTLRGVLGVISPGELTCEVSLQGAADRSPLPIYQPIAVPVGARDSRGPLGDRS